MNDGASGAGVGRGLIPVVHTVNKEKQKGAKRKRNDYYYDCYPLFMGGPFPVIKVGHTGLSNTLGQKRAGFPPFLACFGAVMVI